MQRFLLPVLLLAAISAQAQSPQDLFQQALRLERSQGDLAGAITLYEQIADNPSGERATAAQALLHLGKAYEALGRNEATGAYRRLIAEYAEYPDLVREAQGRLASLAPGEREAPPAIAAPTRTLERLNLPTSEFWRSKVSPDGKLVLAYDFGGLLMVNLETGESSLLAVKEAPNSNDWASDGRFSPDMDRVAYVYHSGEIIQTATGRHWKDVSVRVRDRATGESRILVDVDETVGGSKHYAYLVDWTPDGHTLIATLMANWGDRDEIITRLVAIDTRTGAVKTILDPGPEEPTCVTGDGAFVLFAGAEKKVSRVSVSEGRTTSWLDLEGTYLVGCNDEYAILAGDLFGDYALMYQEIADGLPIGAPQIVTRLAEDNFLGADISPSGDVYLFPSNSQSLFRAPMDARTGVLTGPVQRVKNNSLGPRDVRPDGSVLAWFFGHCLRSVGPGGEASPCTYLEDQGSGNVAWLDGENRIVGQIGRDPRVAVFKWGSGRRQAAFDGYQFQDVIDSTTVLATRDDCLVALNVDTGSTRTLYCGEHGNRWRLGPYAASVSSDGTTAAFSARVVESADTLTAIGTIDISSGDVSFLPYRYRIIVRPWFLPDNSGLVFWQGKGDSGNETVVLPLPEGDETSPWFLQLRGYESVNRLEFAPDGRSVWFGGRVRGSNDWRMAVVRGVFGQ